MAPWRQLRLCAIPSSSSSSPSRRPRTIWASEPRTSKQVSSRVFFTSPVGPPICYDLVRSLIRFLLSFLTLRPIFSFPLTNSFLFLPPTPFPSLAGNDTPSFHSLSFWYPPPSFHEEPVCCRSSPGPRSISFLDDDDRFSPFQRITTFPG